MSGSTPALVERVRTEPLPHWLGMVAAIVVGLAAASLHWIGLVVGGALVGLLAPSLRRAILAGLGFGMLAVLGWLGTLAVAGSLGEVLAMGLFLWLAVAIGIVAPVLGSLLRGVV